MSKKTITIEVPDGLPDGWECCGYGEPIPGETMYHCNNEWVLTSSGKWANCWLIARRTETPADWANKQPLIKMLSSVLVNGQVLRLSDGGIHDLLSYTNGVICIKAEECSEKHIGSRIRVQSGKWTNA